MSQYVKTWVQLDLRNVKRDMRVFTSTTSSSSVYDNVHSNVYMHYIFIKSKVVCWKRLLPKPFSECSCTFSVLHGYSSRILFPLQLLKSVVQFLCLLEFSGISVGLEPVKFKRNKRSIYIILLSLNPSERIKLPEVYEIRVQLFLLRSIRNTCMLFQPKPNQ